MIDYIYNTNDHLNEILQFLSKTKVQESVEAQLEGYTIVGYNGLFRSLQV